jgi:hypothetical protein
MPASKLPADLLRARLSKRAQEQVALSNNITPKRLLKSPSQRRSEAAKKKELKRAGVSAVAPVPCDCYGCPKEPCGKTLNGCEERAMVHRCARCGNKWRHRIVIGTPWEFCPLCRS